ncbi:MULTISPECIES: ATP-binding protein [Thermoactinomyces]|jgi:two-component system sensor histidine kinase VicK|uniref:histidine kinase n=1 Tax=Thermoactinomyces daqus TaxID=1329516 RepID=A0A7W2AHN2_9BACL|nr:MULTISPECIES: ATP-binding protein [Thermoactinomyces]MBA4541904.1 HAMP domain-containing protein [Thermoactinomyces daqus]MBH8597903.1 HAMP domain-containing protein [Thermoactinomyces sp. CICC 10523]MBH8604256.1 HAMP domain-containing protein [Thermoactinomyces sp. CICC 10522]MBH8607711.1 HAMP domain-containing protein [Thermoactinomyces sp. CICC 10521]
MKKWLQLANSIQWKLVVIYLLLIVIAMQLIGVYFFRQLENYLTDSLRGQIRNNAVAIQQTIKDELAKPENDERNKTILYWLNTLVPRTSKMTVQVIDQNNFVIASTSSKQSKIKQPFNFQLPAKGSASFKRRDPATNKDFQVYIQSIKGENGKNLGMIYIEAPLDGTYATIFAISKILLKITAVAVVISSFLIIILARTITSPVKEITEQATIMAAGDFNRQVDVRSKDEIGQLGIAFNHLASHLRNALAEKEEEKEKLESVLANMSDGVIATDSKGNIIVKNAWAEKLLECPVKIGDSFNRVLPLSEPIQFPLREEKQTFLELNSDDPEELTILKITLTPVKLKGAHQTGMVAVLEDVTEQEKLDRQRKDFVANVSHELRTPLTTIKSYLEALDDGAINEPELATRFLKVTRQEADRMTRLIQDLLQLSRLDAQKSKFAKKPVSVELMLEEAVDRFSFQCKQKNISLTLYIHERIPRVYADPDKLDQVLDNLISNAVKYTPDGGSVAVVAQEKADGMVEIGVADTGIGIPKKDLGRIFERFYRVDKARSRSMGGTGLGLSIAQQIVHGHQGEIEIDSVYKKGTLVSFTLPPVSGGNVHE